MTATRQRDLAARALPWLLLAIALTLVVLQVERPSRLINVWVPWARIGALAMVMTAIIITGGIDLSVGSMVALCSMVLGVLWRDFGWPAGVAALGAVAVGVAAGAFNGALVVAGLSPLVATLATMAFYSGLAMTVSGAERIFGFPEEFLAWSQAGGVPPEFWLLAAVLVAAHVAVHHTRLGRWCYAIGDNRLAAKFAAVPVARTEWILYTASGLVASLVAVLYTMDRNAAVPDVHQGVELQAIACVVIGGTLITGGRGDVWRTLLGLAIVSHLDIGLTFLSVSVTAFTAQTRLIVIGALLVAVAISNERLVRDGR